MTHDARRSPVARVARSLRDGGTGRRRLVAAVIVNASLLAATGYIATTTTDLLLLAYWALGVGVLTACVAAFLVGVRHTHLPIAAGRVLCIVPAYNEPQESLERTVRALLRQTVPLDIIVIDDGSATPVEPFTDDPRVTWMRQANTGKRGAQVAVLRSIPREQYAFILTVDSDSEPFPDACEHLLRAMSDSSVQAATGFIYVRNHAGSLVALAADIDIGASCVMMRASRSLLGALETTSGALALYRSELLFDHLDAYAVECGTGDDRWLALRALRRGKVVGVAEAGVETAMPEDLRGTYRQRLRWARSWWWMLPYVFRNLSPAQLVSPTYGLLQLLISPFFFGYAAWAVASLGLGRELPVGFDIVAICVGAYLVVRYGLSALYLIGRPNLSRFDKLFALFIGTPAAIVLNVVLLTPTRYWALTRLFDNRWQTRTVDPNAVVS